MKKRWRIIVLLLVVFLALTGAGSAWLGFMPFGRPSNEEDFIAEQLRRVRYAGPFRSDNEKALADALPENPTTDDLRVAYGRLVIALRAKQAEEFAEANPEYAKLNTPPKDFAARQAYDKACELGGKLDKQFGISGWEDYSTGIADPSKRASFFRDTVPVMDLLRQSVPAPGKAMLDYDADRTDEYGLRYESTAPVRVATARACLLLANGANDEGLQTLREVMDFARRTDWTQMGIGWLFYDLCIEITLQRAVVPLAQRGLLPVDVLADFSDAGKLRRPDGIETARLEFAEYLLWAPRAAKRSTATTSQIEANIWREMIKLDLEKYGATSLSDWIDRQCATIDGENECSVRAKFLSRFQGSHPDLHDPAHAAAFLDQAAQEPARFDISLGVIARCATPLLETEADLLIVKLHELRLRHPDKWQSMIQAAADKYPLVRAVRNGDVVDIHRNTAHPMVQTLGRTDSVLRTFK